MICSKIEGRRAEDQFRHPRVPSQQESEIGHNRGDDSSLGRESGLEVLRSFAERRPDRIQIRRKANIESWACSGIRLTPRSEVRALASISSSWTEDYSLSPDEMLAPLRATTLSTFSICSRARHFGFCCCRTSHYGCGDRSCFVSHWRSKMRWPHEQNRMRQICLIRFCWNF
jgi:hypothetical protein